MLLERASAAAAVMRVCLHEDMERVTAVPEPCYIRRKNQCDVQYIDLGCIEFDMFGMPEPSNSTGTRVLRHNNIHSCAGKP